MSDEEEVEEDLTGKTDSKGNRLDYEASAHARPRTKGQFRHGDPLNDRKSGHS